MILKYVRIGITSDFHLGFGRGKRKDDSRIQAERAMKKLIDLDSDLIIVAGDVFNSPVPRPEVFRDAANILKLPMRKKSDIRLTGVGTNSPEVRGIPVLAIHGNHERRVRGDVNPVKLMDIMGYLVYLQNSGVMVGDLGIYGLGNVPESYAPTVFSSLNTKPFGKTSFFVFHQDLDPFLPRAKLKIKNLPHGFSYYLNGHIHASQLEKNVLIIGSTIVTQMKENETEKFVWTYDEGEGFTKYKIDSRPLFNIKVNANEKSPSEILKEIDQVISKILKDETKEEPMIRIRVKGKLAKGFKPADLLFRNDYNAILSFDKRLEGSVLSSRDLTDIDLDEVVVKTLKKVLDERGLKLNPSELYINLMRGDERAVWDMLEAKL